MSQLLLNRSEAATSAGKKQRSGPAPLPDIDSGDAHDPLAATDWVQDIFAYYKRMEPQIRVSPDYMQRQVGGGAGVAQLLMSGGGCSVVLGCDPRKILLLLGALGAVW